MNDNKRKRSEAAVRVRDIKARLVALKSELAGLKRLNFLDQMVEEIVKAPDTSICSTSVTWTTSYLSSQSLSTSRKTA